MVLAEKTCISWSDQVVYCQILRLCHLLSDQWHCWVPRCLGHNLTLPWFEGTLENQVRFDTQCCDQSRGLSFTHLSICSLLSVSNSPVDEFIEEVVILWTGPIAFLIPLYIPQIFPVFATSWIFWLSSTYNSFAHLLAVCWPFVFYYWHHHSWFGVKSITRFRGFLFKRV